MGKLVLRNLMFKTG